MGKRKRMDYDDVEETTVDSISEESEEMSEASTQQDNEADDVQTDEEAYEDEQQDEEEYPEDEYEEDEESYKRRMRRKRRIRNQLLSYLFVLIILALIGVGIYYAYLYASSYFTEKNTEKEVEAQIEAMTEEEEIVIEAPEIVEEPEIEEEPVEEVDYLGEMVDTVIREMPLEDKVAQLFMITPEMLTGVDSATEAGNGTSEALNKYAVAGLVYSSKNIKDAEQFTNLIAGTQSMSKYELFIAVTEPGGEGSTVLSSAIQEIPQTQTPSEIAEAGDSSQAYNTGATISSYLTSYGINLDLAPCADRVQDEKAINAALSYGSDEAVVSDMIAQMVGGIQSGEAKACITGFPGQGNVTEATLDGRVESSISSDELAGALVPYISGIGAGAQFVMLNNVVYSSIEGETDPASLSRYMISTMLRSTMGFDGIIITAPLNEKAITEYYTSGEAALMALSAGADIIYAPENFEEAYQVVLEAAANDEKMVERIDSSLERIFRVKFADDIVGQ